MNTPAAPSLILTELQATFQVAHDPIGWRINVGPDCYCRPDGAGRIKSWIHTADHNPEVFRYGIDLLNAVIRHIFARHERAGFRGPHSEKRRHTLETICEAANEILHAGEQELWIGRKH